MIDKRFGIPEYKSDAFDNVEYQLKITYTLETDKRIMSFVNNLWGFEVTGGTDQFEPLTIINVQRTGLARRAGIRIGDKITRINNLPADNLTLTEAQLFINQCGRYVKIYVKGDDDDDSDDEYTVDCWFTPRKPWKRDFTPIQWTFPWNDRKKTVFKESNCFMVPSVMEAKIRARRSGTSAIMQPKRTPRGPGETRSMTPSRPTTTQSNNLEPINEGGGFFKADPKGR